MATRNIQKILLKRTNTPGRKPTTLDLGELGVNNADAKLYLSSTTQNNIVEVGWDKINRSGDTMTGTLFVPTISATTYSNLPYWSAGTGTNAIATINSGNIASGQYSVAEGINTKANGYASHTEGESTETQGQASHAQGYLSIASGPYSHAQGYNNQSYGDQSFAGGQNSISSGDTSFVFGNNSIAGGNNSIVLGSNITGNTDNTTYVDKFNIKNISTGTSITNLGVDIDGNVISGSTGGLGKIQIFYNPLDYGAIGDGITDDTVALNYTIALANANNGIVFIPNYINIGVSSSILLPSNTSIMGGNKYSSRITLLASGDTTSKVLRNEDFASGNENIDISNLTIDGRNLENSVALELQKCSNIKLDNLFITRGGIEGIYCYNSTNVMLSNIEAYYNGEYRVDASGIHIDSCDGFQINGAISYLNGFHGIICSSSTNGYIQATVHSNGFNGVFTQFECSDLIIDVNSWNNFRGVYLIGSKNINVNGTIHNNVNGLLTNESTNIIANVNSYENEENDVYLVGETDTVKWVGFPLKPIARFEYGTSELSIESNSTYTNFTRNFIEGENSNSVASNSIVLGNNITAYNDDTTYVDNFNIKTIGGGTSITNLGVDIDGNIVSGSTGSQDIQQTLENGNTANIDFGNYNSTGEVKLFTYDNFTYGGRVSYEINNDIYGGTSFKQLANGFQLYTRNPDYSYVTNIETDSYYGINFRLINPDSDASFTFPNNKNGNHTIATLDDIPSGGTQDLQSVLENGGTATISHSDEDSEYSGTFNLNANGVYLKSEAGGEAGISELELLEGNFQLLQAVRNNDGVNYRSVNLSFDNFPEDVDGENIAHSLKLPFKSGTLATKDDTVFQKILEADGIAEITNEFSVRSKETIDRHGNLYAVPTSAGVFGLWDGNEGTLIVNEGLTTITQGASGGSLLTTVLFETPTINSTLKFPAKTDDGDYTIATLDDIPTGGTQDLQSVLDNGSSAYANNSLSFVKIDVEADRIFGVNIQSPENVSDSGTFLGLMEEQFNVSVIHQDREIINSSNISATPESIELTNDSSEGGRTTLRIMANASDEVEYTLPNKPSGTYTLATTDQIRPYNVCTLLISQSGTSEPTVVYLENTIGNIVWTRITTGLYYGTLTGAFPADKIHLSITPSSPSGSYSIFRNTDDIIVIKTQDNGTVPLTDADSKLFSNSVEIRVYN